MEKQLIGKEHLKIVKHYTENSFINNNDIGSGLKFLENLETTNIIITNRAPTKEDTADIFIDLEDRKNYVILPPPAIPEDFEDKDERATGYIRPENIPGIVMPIEPPEQEPEEESLGLQEKTVAPQALYRQIITPDEGYDGISKITVEKVTSSIDDNITPRNIKKGVSILGVEGDFEVEFEINENFEGELSQENFNQLFKTIEILEVHRVSIIDTEAFKNCNYLEKITLPTTITTINTDAFSGCTNLTDVYYNGTLAQWNAISINSGNECLINATLHCKGDE